MFRQNPQVNWILCSNSVGKENAMNLSDHESSESDGDTDAMCGNVLPITNCMEYLHSYSTPIINEDQLMKTSVSSSDSLLS
jgi:hypothetical protein